MQLSRDQQAAATHGIGAAPTFEWVEMPVGAQPLPIWARGLDVNWMDGYGNAPYCVLRPSAAGGERVSQWRGKVWQVRPDGAYVAESGDGRADCLYHHGELKLRPLRHRHACLPVLPRAPRTVSGGVEMGWYWPIQYWFNEVPCWATPQDAGFGGHEFGITLEDGRIVVLRGPWHGSPPADYVEVHVHRQGSLLLSETVFLTLLARYQAHVRVARVTDKWGSNLEVVRPDWDKPKSCRR